MSTTRQSLLHTNWRWWTKLLYILIICSWCLCNFIPKVSSLSTLSRRVVHTKQGIIQGFLGPGNVRISSQYGSSYNYRGYGGRPVVEIFKGIPYASKPVGALRYESPAPVPYSSSNDVYFANVTKPPCPRTYADFLNRTNYEDPIRALRKTIDLEDCLYLDLYAPYHSDKEKGDGLPVLVYVNSEVDDPKDPWDGSSMAAIGNIIVITFRYRVGVLGFLQPGFSEDNRSNFGLWDQLAALQWIKENVDKFGGNPNIITLMGHDLDANLAGILALSKISADAYGGLFARLILLNGSPFSPTSINHQPLDTTFHLSSALSCPLHERTSGELVSCLRSKTTPQLLTASENMGTPLLSYRFAPSVDGTIVKEDFLQNGNIKINKDLLGRYDLLCGLREGPTLPRVGRPPWQSFNLEQFVTAIIKLTLRMEPSSEPTEDVKRNLIQAIVREYGSAPSMRDLMSDYLMVHPIIQLLNAHSDIGKKNTFFYVFKDFDPQRKGKHSEIPYIFSTDVYNWKYTGSPQTIAELQTFEALITLLANFVRTGDPNMSERSERYTNAARSWPKYTPDLGLYLEIGKDVDVPSNYRDIKMKFWSYVFPAIIQPFARSYYNGSNNEFFPLGPFPGGGGVGGSSSSGSGSSSNSNNKHRNIHVYPTPSTTNSSMSQNAVVLIGCLLLLLNTLCFLGLFYQRERLKKAEIQLRKRYLDSHHSNSNIHDDNHHNHHGHGHGRGVDLNEVEEEEDDIDSAYNRAPRPQCPIPARDAMSETETENGFGPDFLGPNYDPRTKVNRWMNLQNQGVGMGGGNLAMSEPPHHHHYASSPLHHNMHQPSHPQHPHDMQRPMSNPNSQVASTPPLKIHVSSIQRSPKPAEVLPHFPYQEPFQPSPNYDIPYADSRNTSPSIVTSTPYNNNLTTNNFNNSNRRTLPGYEVKESPSASSPKRGSVLIVRDLDPLDDEVEALGPKYIPVKTGTLKRSVGVGIDDSNGNGKELTSTSSTTSNNEQKPSLVTAPTVSPEPSNTSVVAPSTNPSVSTVKKITFADGL